MEPMEFIPLDWQPLPAFPVSSTQDHTPRCEHGNPVGVCTVCHMWSQVSSTNCHAPGHTDLMVTPESIDAWLEKNPLSECTCGGEADQPADHHDISCPLAVSPADRVTEA
jgi:hypothetical protein